MTWNEYLQRVAIAQRENPSWRMGQTYFNVLHDHEPEIADRFRATTLDPFHRDERLPNFLAALVEWFK